MPTVAEMEEVSKDPLLALRRTTDFLRQGLDLEDATLQQLRRDPVDVATFCDFFKACCEAAITVLQRQYVRHFAMVVTDELLSETQSARLHKIDAEEIMGMFSAYKERSKAACMDFLEAKMRARKGKVRVNNIML